MGVVVEVAAALAIYEVANDLFRVRWEATHSTRNGLQHVCCPPTYTVVTRINSLSSHSSPDEEEAVKAHTIWSSFSYDSVNVIYEQDVGSKSSITADTASWKDLTLQGCTNFPL